MAPVGSGYGNASASMKGSGAPPPMADSDAGKHPVSRMFSCGDCQRIIASQGDIWPEAWIGSHFSTGPNTIIELIPSEGEIREIGRNDFRPHVDAFYDSGGHRVVLLFDLPGFDKNDIAVEIDARALIVSGKREQLQEKKSSEGQRSQPLVRERTFGHFCRKFQLPWNAVADDLTACMRDDGVLEISVKTRDADEAERRKAVTIS